MFGNLPTGLFTMDVARYSQEALKEERTLAPVDSRIIPRY